MWSPASVVLSEITMQNIENQIIQNSPAPIVFWKRYIDDIIAAVPSDNVYDILIFINSINPAIQFTCERENFGSLPLLDLMIQRKNDGRISFVGIYRKPTHTGQYLNYFSHHPLSQKKSVASALYNRAFSLCSTEHREDEIKLIYDN